MSRTGILIALAIAVIVGVVFGLWPRLDLEIARPFYVPERNGFYLAWTRWTLIGRDLASWIIALLAAPSAVALVVKVVRPDWPLLVSGRAIVFLLATLALGPGLLANGVLKEHWGRPRPIDVTEFKGTDPFVAWWDTGGACPANCSFIGGESAGAFWTLAPAALAPPAWRPAAYAAAFVFAAAVGALRIVGGGHFFSDVVFSGVFVFAIIWIAHGLIYRWSRTRISDAAVERAIERVVWRLRGLFRRGEDKGRMTKTIVKGPINPGDTGGHS